MYRSDTKRSWEGIGCGNGNENRAAAPAPLWKAWASSHHLRCRQRRPSAVRRCPRPRRVLCPRETGSVLSPFDLSHSGPRHPFLTRWSLATPSNARQMHAHRPQLSTEPTAERRVEETDGWPEPECLMAIRSLSIFSGCAHTCQPIHSSLQGRARQPERFGSPVTGEALPAESESPPDTPMGTYGLQPTMSTS
jgi:hypothetical protein